MSHESPAATADMAVLSGLLGCRTLRRNVQVWSYSGQSCHPFELSHREPDRQL